MMNNMNSLDNDIKNALNAKTENIKASDCLLSEIKMSLEEKENGLMKKTRLTPRAIIAAVVLTVICATGVVASGGLKGIVSSGSRNDDINHFPTQEEVRKIVDYSPKYAEELQGYKFNHAGIRSTSDVDDGGNKSNTHKEIGFWYNTEKGFLTLNTSPVVREDDSKGKEEISYNDLTLYYDSYVYKAVPPEYKVTEEEKKLEAEGELMIGYGSTEVEEEKSQSIIWVVDGITYDLLDMGAEIPKETFINMAKQLVDMK